MNPPNKTERAEYARRRRQLMQEMGENSIAVVPSARPAVRNGDVHYPFRQDSDLLYLCGFPEPEAVAVLVPGRSHGEFVLFCRERDAERERWDGRRAGPEGAVRDWGADDAFPIDDIDDILPGLLENKDKVYYTMGRYPEFDQRMVEWVNRVKRNVRAGVRAPTEFVSLDYLLNEMRLVKSAVELRWMRRAAAITCAAHRRAMRACRPGLTEYQLAAEYLYEFARHGAEPAYPAIVGGGANACVLHYIENSAPLADGDLVLVDAGAEYHGYAADVTRTFPVNGRFSAVQREVYEAVLEAQQAALDAVKPGNHWNDPHDAAVKALTRGLVALGVLRGQVAQLIRRGVYREYYMHRTGHWLGLDVHDVGDYRIDGEWRLLEPGMVLTIEPGLYFAPDGKAPKALRGIGVRIEDDVRVDAEACEVLTADVPKTVAEIEAWMNGR